MADTEKESLPPYSDTPIPTSTPTGEKETIITNSLPTSSPPAIKTSYLFPQSFGIYHASGSMSDLVIALKNYDPNLLFHVSTRGSFSSKPSVTLHSGSNEGTPSLATADLQSFSSSIQIVLYPRNTGSGGESGGANWNRNGKEEGKEPIQEKLKSEGAFTNAFSFNFEILRSGKGKERFEWKNSQGAEVRSLQGGSRGKKLVRTSTNQVIVAWAPPSAGTRKKGKMRFLRERGELGEDFELMAVVSMLGIMEQARRNNASAGAAGGIAAGAAAGGGGC